MVKKKKAVRPETIITSHINADFDAIASMLAAQKLYPDGVIIFPGSQEKNLRDFFISSTSYLFNMADPGSIDFSATKRLVLVDTKQEARIPQVAGLLKKKDLIIDIYDHHPLMEGDLKGDREVHKITGSTTAILCELMQQKQIIPTPEEATIMAMGIYEDTGLFTYSSTTEEDFKQAGLNVSYTSDETSAFKKLAAGRVDFMPLNELVGWALIKKHFPDKVQDFGTLSKAHSIAELKLIVSKDYPNSQKLLTQFNETLKKVKTMEGYKGILTKYGLKE